VVTVQLTLRNIGDRPFTNLVGSLAAQAPVSAPSGAQSFGALAPGQAATRTFTFTVSASAGTTYSLKLNLQDGSTPYPTLSFGEFRIATAAVAAIESVVLSSESAAPANGWPDRGEIVTATVTLRNSGETAFQALSALLERSGGVEAPSPAGFQAYGVLPGGGTATKQFTFTGGVSCGGSVTASFVVNEGTAPGWNTDACLVSRHDSRDDVLKRRCDRDPELRSSSAVSVGDQRVGFDRQCDQRTRAAERSLPYLAGRRRRSPRRACG
jgi:hypothetical protein